MLKRIVVTSAAAATVVAAASAVMAPLPPDAYGYISSGALALAAASALWFGGSRGTRRMLAMVVAVAGVRVGFALDARPAQIGALVVIAAAVAARVLARTSQPAGS